MNQKPSSIMISPARELREGRFESFPVNVLATPQTRGPAENHVLASLPPEDRAALKACCSYASFEPAATVQPADEIVEHVYFPVSGVASLQIDLRKRTVDTALLGRDSVLNPMSAVESRRSPTRCIARTALVVHKISAHKFRQLAQIFPAILKASIDFNESLLHQTRINAARYSCYPVDVRLALCLMEASHLLDSNNLTFSQETLGEMLAVRRTSVTEAATALRNAGAIKYSRGRIVILDRSALFNVSRN